jgi:hypothetical protein
VRISRYAAEKFYPPRLLRTSKEESNIEEEETPVEIKNEIDRLQALLALMQAGSKKHEPQQLEGPQQPELLTDMTTTPSSTSNSSSSTSHSIASKNCDSKTDSHSTPPPGDSPDDTCKVCYDAKINCVLIRCGHMCTCLECSQQLEKCPICRKYIDDVIQTFRS